ncbi:NUDIX hydrolase [Nodosilinea sp. LEGE 07088]|uniref:NUDIX domain-containing protein n=1 Tax=Nodosilinea sp. LEGE 07088 TaxID=2777968 RepID=UPI00187E4C15|nr:NUDIX hydrolase [Nodosilinea sp. LEGE 07088]MBE9140884.1 NUDIX hydrolase [Nodosilinea sp. LEGE 07088]
MAYFAHAVRTLLGLLLRRPILGTCVIPLLADGTIVLVRRRDNGLWSLPGGLVDWGEDVMTSAARELQEEAGLQMVELERLVGVYSQPQRDPRFHSVCVTVAVRVKGHPYAADPGEVLETRAFTATDLPWADLSHDHRQHLQDFFKGATVLA